MTPDVSLWTKRASSACNFYKLWPKCGTGGLSVAASWLARLAAFMSSAVLEYKVAQMNTFENPSV